jgi:PHP family Zn ribbon phosphoesterase
VTVGVMHRVETLADRPEGSKPQRPIPFKRSVQLDEIIADALEMGVGTKAVEREYQKLIHACGTEFEVLLHAPESLLRQTVSDKIANGILWMREGKVVVEPGYDGEYGKIRIFQDATPTPVDKQLTLF